jgi:hypothetical protein
VPFTAAQAAADLDGYWIPFSSAKIGSGDDALDFDDGDGCSVGIIKPLYAAKAAKLLW